MRLPTPCLLLGCAYLVTALTITQAQDLTIPPDGYSGTVLSTDLVQRANDQFPLSDQTNQGKWSLNAQFSDEFDGPELNQERWHPYNPQWRGRRPTQFHPSNVSVEDGELVFRINQHGEDKLHSGYTHSSGFVKSKERILYGYFEMEAKLMDAPWVSGFWLYDVSPTWWTEIDICENCPGNPERRQDLSSNVHVFRSPKEMGDVKKHFSLTQKHYFPFELQKDYHVWGLEWNEQVIRFYIDGHMFREIENTHWYQPLTINLNNESNKWFGALPDDSRLDQEYRVKYVRIWTQQAK
ncbi:family 16 glycosylhydrolase [Coraliomargarita akajimensis]|uniref:Glycoside hydrolase family 16 n=1 Tax=Coraliomargarita akajimensis (strain DSM 45221 / IAM 15411 / JCM 23193 / KCTC 12865 / 04OKA010-24) TaxID=583355 RepID=D5EN23_CORAD|nr:family 16 glycosylhydrolase [Coraliomargarita akajimensis]ADE53458.1 glycoside hydrolase family 16 [Coraliomargarita akajimensis DSM 45221]